MASAAARLLDDGFVDEVAARFGDGKRVRRLLPGEGRLHVDRPLPFLVVRRRESSSASRADRLAMTQASYLVAGGEDARRDRVGGLVRKLAESGARRDGGFLVLEMWEEQLAQPPTQQRPVAPPTFRVVADPPPELDPTVSRLESELETIELEGAAARVFRSRPRPEGEERAPLGPGVADGERCHWIGLGIAPVYRVDGDLGGDVIYPMVLLELETRLADAILATVHEFSCSVLDADPPHRHTLGRRALVRSAWNIDRRLVEVSDSFEFLRLSTPINEGEAWQEFEERGFEQPPGFRYAPLPIDPEAIKRKLFNLPIERVEDPTLARLFREKQEELDTRIDMLRDRGTPAYLYGSLKLYGPVEDELLRTAEQLLSRLPSHQRDDTRDGFLPAGEMAELAAAEIDRYRARWAEFPKHIELRDDLPPGMMVSKDRLLISRQSRFPRARVAALLGHEVGTHLLTYCNARSQRLHLFHAGLPGYDALQEGLAVLAEFLIGGLSRPRLRLLAARVIACRAMTSGADFIEVFRQLTEELGYPPRAAFTVATRVFRSGGLTKDAVYLRGLLQILDYLGRGGRLAPLFVGKIAQRHLADVEELDRRGVLKPVPLEPSYLDLEQARSRLERVREGMTVLDLVEPGSASDRGGGRAS